MGTTPHHLAQYPCTGVILAGGAASRYDGKPKGLERVADQRIIDRVASALSAVCERVMLVANALDAGEWLPGMRVERDVLTDQGSLGGLHAALHHAQTDVLVVAWDMPFVSAPLLSRLVAAGADADAVVPESDSKRGVEPMCAWYSIRCLEPITRRLAAGDRRVISFFDDLRVARLPAAEVATFGEPAILFMNVNTPADLALAESYTTAHPSPPLHRRPQA
jgi:molybdopterin-guanine dinucleotide biosynthesis protein A